MCSCSDCCAAVMCRGTTLRRKSVTEYLESTKWYPAPLYPAPLYPAPFTHSLNSDGPQVVTSPAWSGERIATICGPAHDHGCNDDHGSEAEFLALIRSNSTTKSNKQIPCWCPHLFSLLALSWNSPYAPALALHLL